MFKSSYLREVRKEKYEHSDVFQEQGQPGARESFSGSMVPGLESLQELNSRFAQYINKARVLEQRNVVFRKQLETLQHMEEEAGLEKIFGKQISTNQERIRELQVERTKLERELRDAEGMLEQFSDRYRNECGYQDQLRGTLEQLNKEQGQPGARESFSGSMVPGLESLQELNSRFAQYINKARVLEQRNVVFRKQLETLQHMEEEAGLEKIFGKQISTNQERIRELQVERTKLERELRDAEGMLEQFSDRYRNECGYQDQLRGTLEQLNKEADTALLRNLEYQIESQLLQDDINATKERHRKNLAEIQTYLNILHQINQTLALMPSVSVGISEEQEKLISQRRVPALSTQLEEYKSALCQLQAQKHKLQTETSALEQAIKTTQESYDEEIQLYNEQIESLRKGIEEAERLLEKYTNECRELAMYQTTLENQLERYKRIIENEDSRLNLAIIGSPIGLFITNYRSAISSPTMTTGGKDITQAFQDIGSVKPRQKNQDKKVIKKKELSSKEVTENVQKALDKEAADCVVVEEEVKETTPLLKAAARTDVPDGAQISKAFDTLCNIVRNRMRRYKQTEAITDFYTKGRYVLVTGESSYLDPCFYSTTSSAGHIFVTICDHSMSPIEPRERKTPSPPPSPSPPATILPVIPPSPSDDNQEGADDPRKGQTPQPGKEKNKKDKHGQRRPTPLTPSSKVPLDSMSYEKVEMVESVEKLSSGLKVKVYEETSMVVETLVEKTTKKKHGNQAT